MADITTAPAFDLNKGIYIPQLTEEFVISKDRKYDYYSTNSGMIPKNPGGGSGGGGGGGGDLSGRVATLEDEMTSVQHTQASQSTDISNIKNKQASQTRKAKESLNMLSAIKTGENLDEIDDIVDNQLILSASQENLYKAI